VTIHATMGTMPLPRLPEAPPRNWPHFTSPLHSPAVVARVGRVLGICFSICFVTGLLSHYQYQPWGWLPEPATPAWGYRLSQGVHVITGITSIPLLLVKLWAVYPKLFEWPPARSVVHALERLSIAVLVAAAIIEVVTGFMNILAWYAWPWDFVFVHRQLGYLVIGALLVHIAVKLPIIRDALSRPTQGVELPGLSRRGLLTATAAGAGIVAVTTVGQTIGTLEPLALLAPRRPQEGPLGVPINRTAVQARVTSHLAGSSWRLAVLGAHSFDVDLAELEAMPAVNRDYPLACVEGWSVSAHWRGPRLMTFVRRAGGDENSRVRITSLEKRGPFAGSIIDGPQLSHALLATHLNGERIDLDHGYPVRLIAPDRAGVFNTKWLATVELM
jgi:hypothetical protein